MQHSLRVTQARALAAVRVDAADVVSLCSRDPADQPAARCATPLQESASILCEEERRVQRGCTHALRSSLNCVAIETNEIDETRFAFVRASASAGAAFS